MLMRQSHWSSLAQIVLATVCWGFGTVMAKRALQEASPLTLNAMMLVASVALLWGLVRVQRVRMRLGSGIFQIALFGLLSPGINLTFGVIGLSLISASLASLIQAAQPALIIGLAWLLLREPPTRSLLALLAVAVVGVLLIVGMDFSVGGSLLGSLLAIAAVICGSIPLVLSRRFVVSLDPLLLVAVQQTVGLGWALTVMLIEWGWNRTASPAVISLTAWGWAAATGVTFFALGYWLYFSGLKAVRANIAAPFLSLIPIFGVGGGYVFLGERLVAVQWVGAILILLAVTGISRQQSTTSEETG